MPIFQFNKLIRNKLPGMYASLNQRIVSRKLDGMALIKELQHKYLEEVAEIPFESGSREDIISELGDVEQVADDIRDLLHITDEEVNAAKRKKLKEKGGFSEGIFVETIELENDDEWVDYYRQEPGKYKEIGGGDFPIIKKGTYRHNKTGNLYEVLGLALQTESNEPLVVYRPLHENEYELFTRPYDMFVEIVQVAGEKRPRFEKIDV